MAERTDPDLPGDANFIPVTNIEVCQDGRTSWLIPKPVEEQANIHHNQLRYAELGRLRQGLPNRYNETRYRS